MQEYEKQFTERPLELASNGLLDPADKMPQFREEINMFTE